MALLYIDGCSHYASGDVLYKHPAASGGPSIVETYPRRPGSKSLYGTFTSWDIPSPIFTSRSTYRVGTAFRGYNLICIRTGSTTQVRIAIYPATSYPAWIKVERGDGSALLAEKDMSGVMLEDEWYYIEFGATIDQTTGSIEVRFNGVAIPELTLSGLDTQQHASISTADRICWQLSTARITDLYVDDSTFHGDCIVETLYPTAAGFHAAWVPSAGANFENVDDLGDIDEDGTYNSSAVQGTKDSFETGNLLSRPASAIKAVALHLTARKDWAGGRIVKPMLRVGATDYLPSADGLILSEVYHGKQDIWELNPATGAAWSESGVNGAEIGYDLVTAT